jgi:hypothetical protein
MMLFIDTEFADQTARELVSIALVSQDGRFEFYAERDPLPAAPSDFVRTVVFCGRFETRKRYPRWADRGLATAPARQ